MKPAVLAATTVLVAGGLAAQPAPQAYTLTMTSGGDTLAIEQVVRTSDRLSVDMLVREQGVRFHFDVDLTPDAVAKSITNRFYRDPAAPEPTQVISVHFDGDSARVSIRGDRTRDLAVAAQDGALPWVFPSNALIEQALLRSRALGHRVDTIPVFNVANGQVAEAVVEWAGDTTAEVRLAEAVLTASLGPDGLLEGIDFPSGRRRVTRESAFRPLPIEAIDYGAPPGAPYTAEEVTVETPEGISLTGTLTLPSRPRPGSPAVVTISGSGRTDRDLRLPGVGGYRGFRDIADTLTRAGIAVLRLDDRGVNGSDPGPTDATFVDEVADIRAALAHLRARPDIDRERLGLVGMSQGGIVATLVAEEEPDLAAVVLIATPAYVGHRALEAQRVASLNPAYVTSEEERRAALQGSRRADSARAARDPNLRFLMEYDPIPAARGLRSPVLVVQGETDRQVTPEQAGVLAHAIEEAGNRRVTLAMLPGVNHLLLDDSEGWPSGHRSLPSKRVSSGALGVLTDWLVSCLGREASR